MSLRTVIAAAVATLAMLASAVAFADPAGRASPSLASLAVPGTASALSMTVLLAIASLAPSIVLVCTCFTRFAVVFSFLKSGIGAPGAPPNQVLVGLALFMTAFVMAPVAESVNQRALQPYMAGQLDEKAALEAATPPMRTFLLKHTRQADLALFYEVSGAARPRNSEDVPLRIAVPAFVVSELRTAFQMGLVVLLPFLVIDLVIATILSALGMVMLPPSVVALPIKLLVFVAADGWRLVVQSLLKGVV